MREKDRLFAIALIDAGLVDLAILLARADQLTSADPLARRSVKQWLESMARTRGPTDEAADDVGCAAIGHGRRRAFIMAAISSSISELCSTHSTPRDAVAEP